MRSPGGYVPSDIQARPSKVWQQGLAMDFDTLTAGRLDKFRYVITTRAGYQSTPPPNFKPVVRTASFVLWKRQGPTPDSASSTSTGPPAHRSTAPVRRAAGSWTRAKTATVLAEPVVNGINAWSRPSPFDAPATASQTLKLRPGVGRCRSSTTARCR